MRVVKRNEGARKPCTRSCSQLARRRRAPGSVCEEATFHMRNLRANRICDEGQQAPLLSNLPSLQSEATPEVETEVSKDSAPGRYSIASSWMRARCSDLEHSEPHKIMPVQSRRGVSELRPASRRRPYLRFEVGTPAQTLHLFGAAVGHVNLCIRTGTT